MKDKEFLQLIVDLRQRLVTEFSRIKDYKQNKNALIKEADYAESVHSTIVEIDSMLKGKVDFE